MEKRLFDLIQKVFIKLGAICDYIIEYGEEIGSDWNWKWTKYQSGKIKVWTNLTTGYHTGKGSSGYGYYNDYTVTIPESVPVLDNTIENVVIFPQAGLGLSWFIPANISGRTIGYRFANTTAVSSSRTLTVHYEFEGRWKTVEGGGCGLSRFLVG